MNSALPYLGPVAGASILAGIAITIGLLLIIVPGLFLITIWAVIVPVIVIERSGALASFGRSRALVRGHGWHVFGTLVLVYIIMLVVNIVLGVIFSALPHVLGDGLSSVISGTLISPFLALVVTLVYYRLVGTLGARGRRPVRRIRPAARSTAGTPSRRRAAAVRRLPSRHPRAAGTSRHLRAAGISHLRAARNHPRSRFPGGTAPSSRAKGQEAVSRAAAGPPDGR